MPRFQPILAIAPATPPRRRRKATLSTSRSARSWPRSNSSKGEACRLDPALAELGQDRLRGFCCQLHTELGQLSRAPDKRVEAAAREPGVDFDRIGKRLDAQHLGCRLLLEKKKRDCQSRHLDD